MRKLVSILMLAAIILAVVVLAILSPGLLLNWMTGRFENNSDGFLLASLQDWVTWAVSLSAWASLALLIFKLRNGASKKENRNDVA